MTAPDEDDAERKMRFLFGLRSRGVTDARVLTAMERIDRGPFVRGLLPTAPMRTCPCPSPAARRSASLRSWG
jgi:protein-L-isoaspartate(D-aspartate) O-methyltransferase